MSTDDKDANDAREPDEPNCNRSGDVQPTDESATVPSDDAIPLSEPIGGEPIGGDQTAPFVASFAEVPLGTLNPNPKPYSQLYSESQSKPDPTPHPGWAGFGLFAVFIIGFVLPLLALGVEAATHVCANIFVDPIPTWWHMGLVALVALVNFLGWRAMTKRQDSGPFLPIGIGIALGISTFYGLVFAPITPGFLIAIIFYGIGLLGLAPVLSLISGIIVASSVSNIRRTNNAGPIAPGVLQGFGLSVLAILLLEGPIVATHYGLVQAQSTDPELSRAGIRLIRTCGSEQTVLRDCYEHTRSVSDISWCLVPSSSWVSIRDARKIYYRAFGRPFNSVPRPKVAAFSSMDETVWSDWDYDVAGEHVGGQAAGVKLAKSKISGSISADAASSSTHWTMLFSNSSLAQQEARAQIKLPPGGVVSGVTLWINGEPREAAFGERNLVRAAYRSVVAHRRDPLLVTASGPDRVMLQCFPVPPRVGSTPGEMKIDIAITAPLKISNGNTAGLIMPRLVEKNFGVDCEHQFDLRSDRPLRSDRLQLTANTWHGTQEYTASVTDNVLSSKGVSIEANRSPNVVTIWSEASLPDQNKYISAIFSDQSLPAPSHLIVVIDGSREMAKHVDAIVTGLSALPKDIDTSVVFASDEKTKMANDLSMDGTEPLRVALRHLANAPFVGGPANEPFLAKAYRVARMQSSPTAILWIHGPQPVAAEDFAIAATNLRTKLYDLEAESGPNRIFDSDMNNADIEVVTSTDDLALDMKNLFDSWGRSTQHMEYTPTFFTPGSTDDRIPSMSDELVDLWAYDQTKQLLKRGDTAGAVKLASRYRLVTPVTGAVVLETKADYKANGIDPDNPDNNASAPAFNMGAAPEPEENLLIAVALIFISWQSWKKRLQLKLAVSRCG